MRSQGLTGKADDVANLKGDSARAAFIKHFKEVQRLQTQLDQYTDLTDAERTAIEQVLPKPERNAFRGVYLQTAQRLRDQRETPGATTSPDVDQLDFEFVLFASATIDYDYIMKLIADFSAAKPGKTSMTREQLIGLIGGDSKFLDERDAISEYVGSLKAGGGLDEAAIRTGYASSRPKRTPPPSPPSPRPTACRPSRSRRSSTPSSTG